MREERDQQWEVVCHLKDENYSLMHNITKLSEEKNSALMSNRDLQLEVRYGGVLQFWQTQTHQLMTKAITIGLHSV